jgi:hypothetical protein
MKVEIKDTIRAYDFKPLLGRADCYVEGIVLERNAIRECGYNAYKIECTKDVFGEDGSLPKGKGSRVGHTVYVPWQVSFMEYQGRVINLSRI